MCSTCRAPSRERSPREKDVSVPGRNPRAGGSLPLPAPLCPLVLLGRAGAQEERRRQDRAVSQWSQNNLDRGLPPRHPLRRAHGPSLETRVPPWRALGEFCTPPPARQSTPRDRRSLSCGWAPSRPENKTQESPDISRTWSLRGAGKGEARGQEYTSAAC